MSQKLVVTRRSKVGWGYNTACSQKWNKDQTSSYLAVDTTSYPDHTGTIKQVLAAIEDDRGFQSIRSGGTYYTEAWFVKHGGKWHKVKNTDENLFELENLFTFFEGEFVADWADVVVD